MRILIPVLLSSLAVIGCTKAVRNPFVGIAPAVASTYGYTVEDPIRIGYSKDIGQNIRYCIEFMSCLRTEAGDQLVFVSRGSTDDPKHDPSSGGFLGLPLRGAIPKGGILDVYILATANGGDTLSLCFDIYHKEPILIPNGLHYVCPSDSGTTAK